MGAWRYTFPHLPLYSSLPCRGIICPARCRDEWEHGAVLLLIFLFYSSLPCRQIIYLAGCRDEWEHGAVLLLIFLFYSSLPCRQIIYPARCRDKWEHGAVLLLIFLFYFFFYLLLDNLSLNLENLHVLKLFIDLPNKNTFFTVFRIRDILVRIRILYHGPLRTRFRILRRILLRILLFSSIKTLDLDPESMHLDPKHCR